MSTRGLIVRDPATKTVVLDTRTDLITRVAGAVTVTLSARTATVTLPTDGTLWYAVSPASAGSSASELPTVTKSGLVVTVALPSTTTTSMTVIVGVY